MASLIAPRTEEELADAVKSAVENRKPLAIEGGATRPVGNPVEDARGITTRDMAGIVLYEPGALTIVAKAGTPLEEIESTLAAENQHLPFEPADYRGLLGTVGQSTIGGVVGAAVAGPRRVQAGGARDSLLGVRFINGEGDIIKNGGRVMKNVTGYDLAKLMCGSWGTLGILTELSFKVLPKPAMTASVILRGLEDPAAVSAMAAAMSSPFDVTGAASLPAVNGEASQTLLRIEGLEKSVNYRLEQLSAVLARKFPKAEIEAVSDDKMARDLWRKIRDVEVLAGGKGNIWRVSVKPSDGPKVVAELSKKITLEAQYDWAGGLVWLSAPEMTETDATHLRSVVSQHGGHATLFKRKTGTLEGVPAFQPEEGRISSLSEGLRAQFDPHAVLNPGRMGQHRARQPA